MDRKEFFEWLNTCPTHKFEIQFDMVGFIHVSFKVDEEEYTTDNFHYVKAEDLAEIISSATGHVEALKNFDDFVEELSK